MYPFVIVYNQKNIIKGAIVGVKAYDGFFNAPTEVI